MGLKGRRGARAAPKMRRTAHGLRVTDFATRRHCRFTNRGVFSRAASRPRHVLRPTMRPLISHRGVVRMQLGHTTEAPKEARVLRIADAASEAAAAEARADFALPDVLQLEGLILNLDAALRV